MFSKTSVVGKDANPLYVDLAHADEQAARVEFPQVPARPQRQAGPELRQRRVADRSPLRLGDRAAARRPDGRAAGAAIGKPSVAGIAISARSTSVRRRGAAAWVTVEIFPRVPLDIAVVGAGICRAVVRVALRRGAARRARRGAAPASRCTRRTTTRRRAHAHGRRRRRRRRASGRHRLPRLQPRAPIRNSSRCSTTLGVETVASEMTFSVRVGRPRHARDRVGGHTTSTPCSSSGAISSTRASCGCSPTSSASTVRRPRWRPAGDRALETWTLGEFLDAHRYSRAFRDWYLLPMAAAIWSCSTAQMRDFPLATFVRFCANHGLLQIADRPQWYTVAAAARARTSSGSSRRSTTCASRRRRSASPASTIGRHRRRSRCGRAQRNDAATITSCSRATAISRSRCSTTRRATSARCSARSATSRTTRSCIPTPSVLPTRRGAWAAWNYQCDVALGGARRPVGLRPLSDQSAAAGAVRAAA